MATIQNVNNWGCLRFLYDNINSLYLPQDLLGLDALTNGNPINYAPSLSFGMPGGCGSCGDQGSTNNGFVGAQQLRTTPSPIGVLSCDICLFLKLDSGTITTYYMPIITYINNATGFTGAVGNVAGTATSSNPATFAYFNKYKTLCGSPSCPNLGSSTQTAFFSASSGIFVSCGAAFYNANPGSYYSPQWTLSASTHSWVEYQAPDQAGVFHTTTKDGLHLSDTSLGDLFIWDTTLGWIRGSMSDQAIENWVLSTWQSQISQVAASIQTTVRAVANEQSCNCL